MPRRPDPETGLMPELEDAMVSPDMPMAYPTYTMPAPTSARVRARDLMHGFDSQYADQMIGQTVAPLTGEMLVEVRVERDMMRQTVNLHPLTHSGQTREPWLLGERATRALAEQLTEFNPQTRRLNTMQNDYNEARNELRSVVNQLEEVRNHNSTLATTNAELQRQIRWLERELRDANQERRSDD